MTLSPSRLAVLAWAGIGIVLLFSLARPATPLPGDHSWLRRFHTPEVSYERSLGQTFVMNRNGLHAIEFHPASNGLHPSGEIQVALVDVTPGVDSDVVRSGVIRAAELAGRRSYRFEFSPIADSRNRSYRFELTASDMSSGFVLRAAKGEGYPEGTLTVNGRSRWADLAFQTIAPTSSMWHTLWTSRTASGSSGRLVLALLAATWVAMGVMFRALLSIPADAPTSSLN